MDKRDRHAEDNRQDERHERPDGQQRESRLVRLLPRPSAPGPTERPRASMSFSSVAMAFCSCGMQVFWENCIKRRSNLLDSSCFRLDSRRKDIQGGGCWTVGAAELLVESCASLPHYTS